MALPRWTAMDLTPAFSSSFTSWTIWSAHASECKNFSGGHLACVNGIVDTIPAKEALSAWLNDNCLPPHLPARCNCYVQDYTPIILVSRCNPRSWDSPARSKALEKIRLNTPPCNRKSYRGTKKASSSSASSTDTSWYKRGVQRHQVWNLNNLSEKFRYFLSDLLTLWCHKLKTSRRGRQREPPEELKPLS